MSSRDQVLAFLNSVAPRAVTNADICSGTGIRPHPQVFQITRELMNRGLIKGRQLGKEWHFSAQDRPSVQRDRAREILPALAVPSDLDSGMQITPAAFEQAAKLAMSRLYNTPLGRGKVDGIPKTFDLMSGDGQIVGDAKYYTMVGGVSLPPAKFSVIAEYVWLLEKVPASRKFLVFGNDRRVPERWLSTYGALVKDVEFFFRTQEGLLQSLSRA
jgi:hypothetical protein